MRRITLLLITLTITASGQTLLPRISPEEATKHLINEAVPSYPQLAEFARITGNVILQVSIDESGTASVQRVISGHPLLVPPAIEAVNHWKYQPFEVDGKPALVVTVVMVTFGNATAQDATTREGMRFQHEFWSAEESAQSAVIRGDYAGADEELAKAGELVTTYSVGLQNVLEHWQWLTTKGRLRMLQKNYAEAEDCYLKALAIYQKGDKDALGLADSLSNLGKLYAVEKRFDLAHDNLVRSLAIYQKNFKKVAPGNPSARQAYGQTIANQAWMLWQLASQRNDPVDADKQCHTVLEFRNFLSTTDRDSFLSTCERTTKNSSAQH